MWMLKAYSPNREGRTQQDHPANSYSLRYYLSVGFRGGSLLQLNAKDHCPDILQRGGVPVRFELNFLGFGDFVLHLDTDGSWLRTVSGRLHPFAGEDADRDPPPGLRLHPVREPKA